MARLIPKVVIDEIALKPERDVARALVEQLPDDCIVYHSYPWLRPDRNDRTGKVTLREGETDFVVVLPTHGLLVLEVKGGCIDYNAEQRRWSRQLGGGRLKDITDPFEQARRNTHFLKDRILDQGIRDGREVPFAFGYAVVFPDCDYQGPAPPGAEPILIFSARDLPLLAKRVRSALLSWSRRTPVAALDRAMLEGIQRAISPAFQLLPVLFRQVAEQEERLFRLTEEQIRILDLLAQHERAAIEGVAGSGKTMLARAQAQRFADLGKNTLLVCYNRALAGWLDDSIPETYADRITVRHFHALCREWCERAGLAFVPPHHRADAFWTREAPEKLVDAVDMLPERFDAVVIDEGQDFHPDWWLPLELINAASDKGPMYIFYDPAQNIYVKGDQSMPTLGRPFRLPTNCRNTRRIAATCGGIIGQQIPMHPAAPVGLHPSVVVAVGAEEQKRAVQRVLDEWLRQGHLSPRQVAILCPSRMENSSLWEAEALGKYRLTDDLERWRHDEGVLFSTIRGFKGLEADAVIMLDAPKPDSVPYFSRADFYVGASRAKHLLAILATADGIIDIAMR